VVTDKTSLAIKEKSNQLKEKPKLDFGGAEGNVGKSMVLGPISVLTS
jgi:hypothetical protein